MRILVMAGLLLTAGLFAQQTDSPPVTRFSKAVLMQSDDADSGRTAEIKTGFRGKAFFMSLILPGSGELALGSRKMAVIFFSTEVALWSAYFLFNWISDIKADDYSLYAASHAGADVKGKPHQYFVDIEDFDDLAAYNQAMLQNRQPQLMYPEDGSHDWSWDSRASRDRFEKMRLSSDRFESAGLFVIGGVVLNHLVSGIDAIRLAHRNRSAQSSGLVQVRFAGLREGGMKVMVWKGF
jgi:hypothetical protein